MTENSTQEVQLMDIETEKNPREDLHKTPNKDPNVFHLADRESLSNSKYMQKIKAERIVDNRRLIIHKITLENFKSYNGTREIGPFHKVKLILRHVF